MCSVTGARLYEVFLHVCLPVWKYPNGSGAGPQAHKAGADDSLISPVVQLQAVVSPGRSA